MYRTLSVVCTKFPHSRLLLQHVCHTYIVIRGRIGLSYCRGLTNWGRLTASPQWRHLPLETAESSKAHLRKEGNSAFSRHHPINISKKVQHFDTPSQDNPSVGHYAFLHFLPSISLALTRRMCWFLRRGQHWRYNNFLWSLELFYGTDLRKIASFVKAGLTFCRM